MFQRFYFQISLLFQSPQIKPTVGQKPQLSPKPRLGDTIEMTLPPDLTTSGLQTWPLKNKIISTDSVKKTTTPEVKTADQTHNNYNTLPAKTSTSVVSSAASSLVDEVALEEKRLINALKNGVVINEGTTPTPATVVTQKPKVS